MQNEELITSDLASDEQNHPAADEALVEPTLEAEEPIELEDISLESDAPEQERSKPRLWLAVVTTATGAETLIERDRVADLRRDLSSSEITQVKAIYRAVKKDFVVETQVIRKINF